LKKTRWLKERVQNADLLAISRVSASLAAREQAAKAAANQRSSSKGSPSTAGTTQPFNPLKKQVPLINARSGLAAVASSLGVKAPPRPRTPPTAITVTPPTPLTTASFQLSPPSNYRPERPSSLSSPSPSSSRKSGNLVFFGTQDDDGSPVAKLVVNKNQSQNGGRKRQQQTATSQQSQPAAGKIEGTKVVNKGKGEKEQSRTACSLEKQQQHPQQQQQQQQPKPCKGERLISTYTCVFLLQFSEVKLHEVFMSSCIIKEAPSTNLRYLVTWLALTTAQYEECA